MRIETYGEGGYDPNHPTYNIVDIQEVDDPLEPEPVIHNVIEKHHTEHHTVEVLRHPVPMKVAVGSLAVLSVLDLVLNVWK